MDTMTVPLSEVFFPSVVVCNINQASALLNLHSAIFFIIKTELDINNLLSIISSEKCPLMKHLAAAGAKVVLPGVGHLRERDLHQADLLRLHRGQATGVILRGKIIRNIK